MIIAFGIGALLAAVGVVLILHDADKLWTNICALIAGFLTGAGVLTATSLAGVRHTIQNLTWGGVNIALSVAVWCVILGYYEAFKRGDYRGHYWRTPATVFLGAALLPLFSLSGLNVVGTGVTLIGVAVILSVKSRGETKRIAAVCAILGAAMIAGIVGAYLGGVRQYVVAGIGAAAFVSVISGVVCWRQVFHKANRRYHHIWSTVWAGVFGLSVVLAAGAGVSSMLQKSEQHAVSTVSKVTHNHGTGNPFAPAAKGLIGELHKLHH